MVKRTETHITDTKAVRRIFNQLDENWLIRNLEERDYGIDLSLELFNGVSPTGSMTLIQVKGTEKEFDTDSENFIKLSNFPVKTIQYALLFEIPFFVFHISLAKNETKFIWLQKYIERKLSKENPSWESQETVTLYFPISNDLEKNAKKIKDIINRYKDEKIFLIFLKKYEELVFHKSSVYNVIEPQYGVAKYCAEICQKILDECSQVLYKYEEALIEESSEDCFDIKRLIIELESIAINQSVEHSDQEFIDKQIELLWKMKMYIVQDKDLVEKILYETSLEEDYIPY